MFTKATTLESSGGMGMRLRDNLVRKSASLSQGWLAGSLTLVPLSCLPSIWDEHSRERAPRGTRSGQIKWGPKVGAMSTVNDGQFAVEGAFKADAKFTPTGFRLCGAAHSVLTSHT